MECVVVGEFNPFSASKSRTIRKAIVTRETIKRLAFDENWVGLGIKNQLLLGGCARDFGNAGSGVHAPFVAAQTAAA